jgi:hypothetical protein
MRPTLARRCRARRRRDRRHCGAAPGRGGDVDVRLVPVDQRDPIRGYSDVTRVIGVAVDDACLTSHEPRPRCSASIDTLRRHRAEVDLRPDLGVQKVGRRSPAGALRPALRQPVQLAERFGHATPVGLRLGRSALDVGHHHHTVCEQPAVRGRNRHWHGQACTVEVLEELGLPREISVAPGTETTDGKLPVDAHAPHTSLATPPASDSIRATSSLHCLSASHPIGRPAPVLRFTIVRVWPGPCRSDQLLQES